MFNEEIAELFQRYPPDDVNADYIKSCEIRMSWGNVSIPTLWDKFSGSLKVIKQVKSAIVDDPDLGPVFGRARNEYVAAYKQIAAIRIGLLSSMKKDQERDAANKRNDTIRTFKKDIRALDKLIDEYSDIIKGLEEKRKTKQKQLKELEAKK